MSASSSRAIQTFFSNALAAVGGTTAGPGLCCINVYVNYEKKFAFVELRTGGAGTEGADGRHVARVCWAAHTNVHARMASRLPRLR